MKKLTFLSDLLRKLSACLTQTLWRSHGDVTSRLRLVYVSFTSRLRVSQVIDSRMIAVCLLLLTLGVGNAWGTDIVIDLNLKQAGTYPNDFPTLDGTSSGTYTFGGYSFGFSCNNNVKRAGSNNNYYILIGSAGATESNASIITFPAIANYKLTEVVITVATTSGTKVKAYIGSAYNTVLTGGSEWTFNNSSSNNANVHTWSLSSTSANTAYKMYIVRASGNSTYNGQLAGLKLTYEPDGGGCSNSVAITKGSESHGEVTTIATSPVETCSSTASDRRVTITITPDDCYDAPASLTWTKSSGTVTAAMQGTKTDNGDGTFSYVYQFNQNDNGAGTFGVTCTAKTAGKTVNFDAGPLSNPSSLTEDCDGAGVTLPNLNASTVCKGWTTFAGWATAAVSDSTTTSVTIYAAGSKYVPASNNMTLYAVYSKEKGGGSTTLFSEDFSALTDGDDASTSGPSSSATSTSTLTQFSTMSNVFSAGGTAKLGGKSSVGYLVTNAITAAKDDEITISFKVKGWSDVEGDIQVSSNNSTFTAPAATTYSATIEDSYESKSVTVTLTGANPTIKIATTNKRAFIDDLVITKGSSATYYCSDPDCCTPLGSINGSVNWSNPTTAVVTWDNLDHVAASNPYAVTWKTGAGSYSSTGVGSITGTTTKTCTITGLSCNTSYDFKIAVTAASGYCDKEQVIENETSPKYSITRTGGGTVTGGTFTTKISSDAVTEACNGSTISIAATPATGYAFSSWTISKEGGGTVSPAASSASTSFTMPSDNVTVTAAFSCVPPVIGTDPADADYFVGDSPDALSVSATLASGTLTYLWKVSTNGGSTWSDAEGTNNTATYSGASLSASSAGTTQFKCIVGNSEGGCTVESAVATITVTTASYFVNGETVFIQADSKDYSAWKDDACVKAWFNASGAGGAAQTTYWLFDATDTDAGKKLFATVVPASGDLNQVTLQRFASNCSDHWNNNGTLTKASASGVNTFRSYGSADNNVSWNGSSTSLYLYGSQNSWASSLATFADQGAGVWTATISNYTPDATSKDYKIKTSYNNGWIGNGGSNDNATLSDMKVGSTYNITATLDVTDHSLVMSKTFVKGTVSFDLQGHGSAISDLTNVAAGSKISAPSTPTAAGYVFGGWYKEAGCVNAWNFASDVVNETMTLYAKWYQLTLVVKDEDATTLSGVGMPTLTHTGGTALTAAEAGDYAFKQITITSGTGTLSATNTMTPTITAISSDLTITAVFYKPISVTWKVGTGAASGSPTGSVKRGTQWQSLTLPSTPNDNSLEVAQGGCIENGTGKFMGWTNMAGDWTGTSHDEAPAVCLTSFSGVTTEITEPTTFKAVFATEDGSDEATSITSYEDGTYYLIDSIVISGTPQFYSPTGTASGKISSVELTSDVSVTNGVLTLDLTSASLAAAMKYTLTTVGDSITIYNATTSAYVGSASSGTNLTTTNKKKWALSTTDNKRFRFVSETSNRILLYQHSYKQTTPTTAQVYGKQFGHYAASGASTQTGNGGYEWYGSGYFFLVPAGSSKTYSDYITKCCTALSDINGSVTWTNPTEAVVSWDNIANVSSWTVKYKTHAAGEYGTWAGEQTVYTKSTTNDSRKVTITGLTPCVDYDFQIIATPASSDYCDKDQTIEDSQTHTYSVDYSGCSNVTKTAGDATACGSSNLVATFTAELPYELPTTVSVSIGGAAQTQGTDFTWVVSAGVGTLTIGSAKQTGNIVIDVDANLLTCDNDPTVGAAALDGSGTFSNTTIDVSVTSCAPGGVVCAWTDYGFVWGTSANPTVSDNKVQVGTSGTATSWNGSLTGSFTTGTTYYYRAYGKNSKDAAEFVYGTGATFVPRSVTFNSNGGSDVATIYLNSGGTVSAPSAPTRSGYTFGGWYTDNGTWESAVNWSSTISSNVTYYAKWNAITYAITYEGLSGASNTNPTSYNIETSTITLVNPGSRTGYTFTGWTCGGDAITQIAVGSTGDKTITANWTINKHTVAVSAADHVVITATPAGGSAIAESGSNPSVNYGTTVTLNCTPDDHWSLAWDVYKTGESSTKVDLTGEGDGATFTMPDYAVTVTAVMTEATYHTATFKNNGVAVSGYDEVKTYDGERPSAPTLTDITDACDKTDCNKFYGWIAEDGIWNQTINSVAGKTIYRNASSIPVVDGADVVYHAVWAKGEAGPEISSTLIAKWDKQSLTASTAIKAKDPSGSDINAITLTPNYSATNSGGVYCYYNSGVSVYPTITITGLDFSEYDYGGICFFARSSTSAELTVKTSSGGDYANLTTFTTDGKEHPFSITNIPKATTSIQIVSNKNSGAFYFGFTRIYGVNSSPSYNFTELTSSNTSGWTGADWDGYYLITFSSSTKAVRGDGIEGLKGLTDVSPSEGVITTSDIGLIFKATYSAGNSGYTMQGLASQCYVNTAKRSEAYHLLNESAVYISSIDYNQLLLSDGKAFRWNTSSSPYRAGEYGPAYGGAPTLYKIMSTFTEFRITCCDNTVTIGMPAKTGSGTVTFASGGDAYVAGDEVETCYGATTITATVTPTNGYQCTVLSFTRSDEAALTPDPAISVPFTGAQNYDLTFEQNADGVTLNTTVTFVALIDHYIDNMHYNTTQNKSGNYGTAPTLSDESKGEQCTGLHYKFVGWIPENDMNMTTGVPTTTVNMVAGGATGKYATGTNYYAIWAEEE